MKPKLLITWLLTLMAAMMIISVHAQPPASKPMLEKGKTYRLGKDAALVPRNPRDYNAKPHEIDMGTLPNSRTLKSGASFTVRRVREERSGNWYFVDIPDPAAFNPPVKNASGWISEADFGGAPPAEVKMDAAVAGSTKGGPVATETRYLLIFHAAAIRACELRAQAEPARTAEWNKWRDDAKRQRDALLAESGMSNAAAEAMARTTPVEDYALWLAQRQLAERVPPPVRAAEPPIKQPSGNTLIKNFPDPTPTPLPPKPASGSGFIHGGSGSGRQETNFQPNTGATIRR